MKISLETAHTAKLFALLHSKCFSNAPPPYSETSFLNMMLDHNYFFATHKSYAFGIVRFGPSEVELITIAVDPKKRRQGLGNKILTHLVAEIALKKKKAIFLEVNSENTIALRMYKKNGFSQIGLRVGYFNKPDGSNCDAIIMKKTLKV